jgi:hypothetical protein
MPTHKANADEWSLDQVVHELRRQAGADGVADAHVFLDDSLVGDVDGLAHNLVRTARQRSGSGQKADIGKVHDLARSFALRADPTVIAELGRQPGVRAILPSRIADAFPKPVRHRPG